MALDDRKKVILQAIVDDYVTTCEPVGSKALIDRHNFSLSSATLRNEMADLEKMLKTLDWDSMAQLLS